MFVEKIISIGLAHQSYIAGDGREAFVVDPKRDIDSYLKIADSECCRIMFVFETHRNEDYLIGSLELEKQTGCRIIHGGRLDFGYGEPARDGDAFDIGSMRLQVIETPGHSPESLSFVLYPTSRQPWMVFTGDALFYGNAGRVDLLGEEKKFELAASLYDSLHDKLLMLGDHVIIYPGHGTGSACGGDIADIPVSTIGYERLTNPLLKLSREEFIARKMEEAIPLPPYFARMADENHIGPPLIERTRIQPLDVSAFSKIMQDCEIIDTRSPLSFAGGNIPGSYNIWLDGLVTFAGWVLGYDKDILLVTERQEDVDTAGIYLMRIGLDRIKGYLCEGIEGWKNRGMALSMSGTETVTGLHEKLEDKKEVFLLDVREKGEYENGHIPGAVNIYVGELESRLSEVPQDRQIVSICSVGNRAELGASILKRHSYDMVSNLSGGTIAWEKKGYPTEKL
ncbi:MAG TPA: rhodanese-like domain-containing protein [Candidatus Methanoperedens sp.]